MPEVGSSRRTNLEPPRRARPTESLRFWPPESYFARLSCFSFRSSYLIKLSISAPLDPLNIANISKCSLTVKSSNNTSCCGHTPIIPLKKSISLLKSLPKRVTLPPLISYNPVRIEIKVVFPAPLCPRSEKIWPFRSLKLIESRACFPSGYVLLRFQIQRIWFCFSSSLRCKFSGS